MNYTHIVNGEDAADTLREALQCAERQAEPIIVLRDDLAFGPLRAVDDDPGTRAAFWQRVVGDKARGAIDALLSTSSGLPALVRGSGEVVAWHASSPSDQLMLRRLAFHLRNAPQKVNEVNLNLSELRCGGTPASGLARVADFPAEVLQARLRGIAPVSILRIGRLALEWQELKQLDNEIRRWEDNTFHSATFSELDALILEQSDAPGRTALELALGIAATGVGIDAPESIIRWRARELAMAGRLVLENDPPARIRRAVPL